jgi:hypothetical protein
MNLPLLKIAGHPITVGFVVFVVTRVALSPFVGEQVCRDGWHSYSIGIQGACSWHGGVGGLDHGSWVFPLSLFAGIAVGVWRADRRGRKATADPTIPTAPAPPAAGYKTQEQVRAELAEFFAARKAGADRQNPPE